MKYRWIIMFIFLSITGNADAQLQTITDNGNTTNNLIQITGFEKIPVTGSGMELYGGNRAVLQGLNRNTGMGIPLSLNPTNANIHMVENGGNVGIGTTNPGFKLTVMGDSYANGQIYSDMTSNEGGAISLINNSKTGTNVNKWTIYNMTGHYGNSLKFWRYSADLTNTGAQFILNDDGTSSFTGRLGIGTIAPQELLQLGDSPNTGNYKISIPGVYNFENIRLGQCGNGAGALEFINHSGASNSYGIRMYVNTDAVPGLHFQYAPAKADYNSLTYTTGMFMDVGGKVGIGTVYPQYKMDINASDYNHIRLTGGIPLIKFAGDAYNSNNGGEIYQKTDGTMLFNTNSNTNGFVLTANGKMGIGTITPSELLSVNGNIRSRKVIVTQTGWPDYVFDSSYQLPSLDSVSTFIQTNKHLPDMPSAAAVEKDGHDLGEVQKLLLKKMEEMTLYMIKLKAENDALHSRLDAVEQKIKKQ